MRTQSRSVRRHAGLISALTVSGLGTMALVIQLGIGHLETANASSFWRGLNAPVGLVEVEGYSSLGDMVSAADLVITGRIIEVGPGREFGEDGVSIHYAAARVQILEVLAGPRVDPRADSITWELMLPPGEGADEAVALGRMVPADPLLLFLRNKGTEVLAGSALGDAAVERGYYRTVVNGSMVVDQRGTARLPVVPREHQFLSALDGIPFGTVVEKVRAAAAADAS